MEASTDADATNWEAGGDNVSPLRWYGIVLGDFGEKYRNPFVSTCLLVWAAVASSVDVIRPVEHLHYCLTSSTAGFRVMYRVI